MKAFILCLIAALAFLMLSCKEHGTTPDRGSMVGYVLNAKDFSPIAGVVITNNQTSNVFTTDSNGKFFLPGVNPGVLTIIASKNGFTTKQVNVNVKSDRITKDTILLEEQSTPPGDLIAYWSFDDGTARDVTGNGYDGIIIHTPTTVAGVHGKGSALHFVGRGYYSPVPEIPEGDHIILPRIPFENYSKFTISLWANDESMSSFYGDFYLYFGLHEKGWLGIGNHTLQRYENDTTLFSLFSVGADQDIIRPLNNPFDYNLKNNWVHYCFTYQNGVITGYVNGQSIGSTQETIRIGGNYAGMACHWWTYEGEKRTSARFTGSLDEVKIFNRALSSNEVEQLYQN